jgi:hypothetical protein
VALKRWRWVLGPALAAVLLAVLVLPPRVPGEGLLGSVFGRDYDSDVPRDPSGEAVRAAVRTQRWRLRQRKLADSIVRAARGPGALRSVDGAVMVVYERPITRDSARVWLEAASAELALYPRADAPGLPVVLALSAVPARSQDARERLLFSQTVLPLQRAASSVGACVVLLNLGLGRPEWYARGLVARDAAGGPLGRFLDVCALYGRFGLPGPAISAWADRGPAWYWGGYDRLSRRMQEARRALKRDTVASVWWYSTFWRGSVQWAPIACLRGGSETCARVAGLEPASSDVLWWSSRLTRGQLLAWLLATGTPAQFAAFWRSALPPAQSVQAAYGQPAGRVVMEAFRHWSSPPEPGGPRAGTRVVLVGIGWAALALALALVAGRRWQAEI